MLQGDQEQLEQELATLLQQASALGEQYGLAMIKHQERAISLGGGIIGRFLQRAKDIVFGIVGRVRDIVSNILGNGGTAEDAQDAVDNLLESMPEIVAETEVHAEIEQAVADVFEINGVGMIDWVTSPGACPLCETNEEAGPLPRGSSWPSGDERPPAHPSCKCNLVPAGE